MLSILDKEIITEQDLNLLIALKVEESINLDFKEAGALDFSDKKKIEITKDVSAFANSAGGIIIYGIKEVNHVAESVTFIDGNIYTKEWIEQVIQSGIQRTIEGLKIFPIRFDSDIKKSVYVVKIPESSFAPHMTKDRRFYKRYNFQSVQMEEYEIRSLYNRKGITELQIHHITLGKAEYENYGKEEEIVYLPIGFQVENIGKVIEKDFKLIVETNFLDFTLKWNHFSEKELIMSVGENNSRLIPFSNSSPIFPNEIMTIGKLNFGIRKIKLDEILNVGIFNLKLLYSNGMCEEDISLKNIFHLE